MRLDKLLSNLGYGSRTEIKNIVKKGLVIVDSVVVKNPDININPESCLITVDGEKVFYKEKIYLMMNKPQGYICANYDGLHKTVIDLIKEPYSRFEWIIVGRLDLDTEGLLLLTTDGQWAHQITSPKKDVYKKYFVKLEKKLGDYSKLEKGVEIFDGNNTPYVTSPAKVERISDDTCYIYIKEGKFHQVKRMFEAIDNSVVFLKRYQIGNIELDEKLGLGEYKEIII